MLNLIRGILFDSGDTLVRPIGGHWIPHHRFDEIIAEHGVDGLQWENIGDAIAEGQEYLSENHHLTTEDQERAQFQTFYDIVLKGLGAPQPNHSLTHELARVIVDENNMEPFADTQVVIPRLHKSGLRLGILSDTWPSLDRKYRLLGLRDYFDPFVMSAPLGVCKPHPKMYSTAIDGMAIPSGDILFVDNDPENVKGANVAGLKGVLMVRSGPPPVDDLPWIRNLEELEERFSPHFSVL